MAFPSTTRASEPTVPLPPKPTGTKPPVAPAPAPANSTPLAAKVRAAVDAIDKAMGELLAASSTIQLGASTVDVVSTGVVKSADAKVRAQTSALLLAAK
jgi:hypothetical protein